MAYAQSVTSDEKAIRSLLQQMEGAWNKNDMGAYCNSLTEDGTWINVVGMFWRDKKETIKASTWLLLRLCLNIVRLVMIWLN